MKNASLMKPGLCLMLLALLMCLPLTSYAITEQEWNEGCGSKTGQTIQLYDIVYDENGGVISTPTHTVPGGLYIRSGKVDSDSGWLELRYYQNGSICSGWMKMYNNDDLVSCSVMLSIDDGTCTFVNEALLKNPERLHEVINASAPAGVTYTWIPGTTNVHAEGKAEIVWDSGYNPPNATAPSGGNSSNSSRPSGGSSSSGTDGKNSTAPTPTPVVFQYEGAAVEVIRLGVSTSTILLNEEETDVPTAEVTFNTTAEEDRRIAVIHAPRTGKCTLRAKASESGKMVKSCMAGHVVPVLEYGKEWCRILYNGAEGYVLTSCLKWYSAETQGIGVLSYNGKANGSTTINIRNAPDGESFKVAEWYTGTQVQVFSLNDGWYEIECDEIHGFVMDEFLTVEE